MSPWSRKSRTACTGADSAIWRWTRRCPHATTLSKLTRKYGPDVVHDLNRALVQRAREHKLMRCRKLRMDTTVVQAPIDYPTDIGLLADSARVVTRTVRQLQAAGVAVRTGLRSRARSIKRALATVGRSLRMRTDEAKQAVLKQTARVLTGTKQIGRQAERVLRNSRHVGQHIDAKTAAMVKRTRVRLRRQLELTAPGRHAKRGRVSRGRRRFRIGSSACLIPKPVPSAAAS